MISSFCGASACVNVEMNGMFIELWETGRRNSALFYSQEEWDAFVLGIKAGEFDLNVLKGHNNAPIVQH